MSINRREFLHLLTMAAGAGLLPATTAAQQDSGELYQIAAFGNARLLHFTDCHAQLLPVYFREPNVNLGIGPARGQLPHLVGEHLLATAGLAKNGPLAHAFTYLDYTEAARRYGKIGGFAYLATLIKQLREDYGAGKSLLLDGGDTWQGSGTALWTRGKDMLGASNLLGVDVMTGHWEFTYKEDEILANLEDIRLRLALQ
jgi:sulfur-oxidizing protein SoxB